MNHIPQAPATDLTREQVIEEVRDLGETSATDEEIWESWQQVVGGPSTQHDLGRLMAQLQGIAADG